MSNHLYRYLGFAFASADLLLELDLEGRIAFAVGAAGRIANTDAADLIGRNWRELIAEDDHALVEAMFEGLQDGARRGPVSVDLKSKTETKSEVASLSACRLPQLAPSISVSMSINPMVQGLFGNTAAPDNNKLHDVDSLNALAKGMWEVARGTGINVDVCLVEVKGLDAVMRQAPDDGTKALHNIAGALRAGSFGGSSAAKLAQERFALLRDQSSPMTDLVQHVNAAARRAIGTRHDLDIAARAIAFEPKTMRAEQAFRALRFALDQFIANGLSKSLAPSIGEVFQDLVTDTMNRAGSFKAIVESRKFKLAYQPVVALADGRIHHYEVLARFADDESPFGLIRLAEELDLIERFDMVMIETVIAKLLEKDFAQTELAVNISGQSLMNPTFIEALIRLLQTSPECIKRLMFEVTESAALTDLQLADRHIQALRKAGCPVCLDDFGAGAASFPYLKMLTVDAVKIDGQYVRDLTGSSRDHDLVRHLVALCKSLNVKTTAEMVETQDTADLLKTLGVDYGQGWQFGRPQAQLASPQPVKGKTLFRARRKGSILGWG